VRDGLPNEKDGKGVKKTTGVMPDQGQMLKWNLSDQGAGVFILALKRGARGGSHAKCCTEEHWKVGRGQMRTEAGTIPAIKTKEGYTGRQKEKREGLGGEVIQYAGVNALFQSSNRVRPPGREGSGGASPLQVKGGGGKSQSGRAQDNPQSARNKGLGKIGEWYKNEKVSRSGGGEGGGSVFER